MLPNGWEITTVGKACAIRNNLRQPISSEERDLIQGQFPYFGPTGILGYIDHYKIDEEFVLIGEDGDHFLKFKDKEMTLLFSGKANVNNHAHIVTNSEQCLAQWFHLFFMHRDLTSFLTRQGAKRYKLTKASLEKLPLTLPPLSEQKKIAQILSTWDKAITTTEQLIANSQQQKKALMQQLLTGKKRLLDDNGVRFSGEWESKRLSQIAEVYQPKTISQAMLADTGYPVYGANGVIGFYKEFNHGTEQIAVTCRGSTCGVVNWTQPKSWITGNAMVINTDKFPFVNKKFLFYVLEASDLSYLISGSGQPQITGNIKTHVVRIPDIEEQQKIASILSSADREIELLQSKLSALKQEKKALMQQLLTGKRRVLVNTKEKADV